VWVPRPDRPQLFVYYEPMKRKLKIKPIFGVMEDYKLKEIYAPRTQVGRGTLLVLFGRKDIFLLPKKIFLSALS
jgi:hypothetical protein